MDSKVILVVVDGLRDDVAAAQMGFLEHLVEHRVADRFTVVAEMPTMSRPLYETIQTGTPPYVHGIVNNNIVRRSTLPNVFDIVARAGGVTAAAAYWWVSELYNCVPYDPIAHGEVDNPELAIQHGRFYMQDSFPDIELFMQAERLIRQFAPDYLLIHPMGMDDTGHHHGGEFGRILQPRHPRRPGDRQPAPGLDRPGLSGADHRRPRHECQPRPRRQR